jgi:ribosomal protein L3 glutamine methyltransferase
MTVIESGAACPAARLQDAAGVSFGHGTTNAFDEAAWLVLWKLGCRWTRWTAPPTTVGTTATRAARWRAAGDSASSTRQPAAYLTGEAWLQGVPFYVDERAIVPRSLIAEPLADGTLDAWLARTHAARAGPVHRQRQPGRAGGAWPGPTCRWHGPTCRPTRWPWHARNVVRHGLQDRITLLQGDGLAAVAGQRYDLILCNPPYVNRASDGRPARRVPRRARAGPGRWHDGMDFIRGLLAQAPSHLNPHGVLVLEIGHERAHFEAAFPALARGVAAHQRRRRPGAARPPENCSPARGCRYRRPPGRPWLQRSGRIAR